MINKRLRCVLFLLPLVLACTPEHEADIDRVASFYVQRLLDTLPADSGTDLSTGLEYELPALDSITAAWTADEWVRFWERVEEARLSRP
jgi:hypothetical protein